MAAAVRRMVSDGPAPGVAALASTGGRTRFAAAGTADVRSGRPMLRTDRFRAGSLTKTLIATVVLQLAAEKRLELTDPVDRWLPGLVHGNGNDGRRITVRHLLNHTSGLYDYTRDPALAADLSGDRPAGRRLSPAGPARWVAVALAHRPRFRPGADFGYSNTNYVLLGLIIERITGHSYASEVRRRVIVPLRLRGTSFPGSRTTLPAPHGRGYTTGRASTGPTRRDVTELDPSVAGAAGELVSTLDDLVRLFAALLDGRLLPPAQLRQMQNTTATDGRYGLGLFPVSLPCGVRLWGHNGTISGSTALVVATGDGRQVLGYHLNHDAGVPARAQTAVLTAAFCGRSVP